MPTVVIVSPKGGAGKSTAAVLLESRLDGKIGALESQIGELRERMAHLEGLLEGLREAITGRRAAASEDPLY